jgi:hypothetical protein
MTYISDIEAASLIQNFGLASSEVTDESGSTVSKLNDGSTLTHQCDTSKPLGWEHEPVDTAAEVPNDVAAPEPQPVDAQGNLIPAPEAAPVEPPVVAEA